MGTGTAGTGDTILDFVSEDKVSADITLVYGGTKSPSQVRPMVTPMPSLVHVASTGVFTVATIAAGGFHTLIATAASAAASRQLNLK